MPSPSVSREKLDKLVGYYSSLQYDNIPEEVKNIARKCVIDVVACAIGGSDIESSRIINDYCTERFAGRESQVWLDGSFLSAPGAAFVNAAMSAALDMDDGSRTALGHPGGVIIPAVAAIGQKIDCSFRDFIVAIVCGYDIGVRFGEVLLMNTTDGRFHGTGTWGVVGAAAGIGKLLRFSSGAFLNALGIAEAYASLSPVMKSIQNGSGTKETMGWAAMSSINSVELADKGLTGVTSMLYHRKESSNYSGLEDLGKDFRIFKTYFKQYSACRWTHAPMEAVGILKKHRFFTADEVKRVLVKTHEKAMSCSTVIPTNAIQAEYSIPFAVANMIIHDQMGPDQLTAKNLHFPSIQNLAKKIRIEHSDDCEKRFPEKNTAVVVIELLDGSVLRSGIISPRGDYDDPLSMDEIIHKYHWLTGRKWDEKHRDAVLSRILSAGRDKETSLRNLFV